MPDKSNKLIEAAVRVYEFLATHIVKHAFNFDFIKPIIENYNELNDETSKKEFKYLIEEYQREYLYHGWNIFGSAYRATVLFATF